MAVPLRVHSSAGPFVLQHWPRRTQLSGGSSSMVYGMLVPGVIAVDESVATVRRLCSPLSLAFDTPDARASATFRAKHC